MGCDFPGASFPSWPSIRSRRLVDGFLLKPILACKGAPWRSASVKLGSPKSPEGSSDRSNWSNTPNSSSGLAQFNDWLFAFFPSFLNFYGLLRRGGARQGDTPLSRRSFREQETVLRYGNPLKPRIFGLVHVLRSRERFLNRFTFVHKNLRLKNGL